MEVVEHTAEMKLTGLIWDIGILETTTFFLG